VRLWLQLKPVDVFPTGKHLESEQKSDGKPCQLLNLQTRPHQAPVRLAVEEEPGVEAMYYRYACTVNAPPQKKTEVRRAMGQSQTFDSHIKGVLCAGCAYYWNYKSPLPSYFDRLWLHQRDAKNTGFIKHLKHCIYP
jgi:hypothetical protein